MKAAPPKLNSTNTRFWVTLSVTVILAGATVLYFFDPATHHFYPVCQFHRLTGWNCPGCGLTRSFHALLHADFATASRDNALLILTLLLLLLRGVWFGWNRLRQRPTGEFFPAKFLWWLLAAAVIFAVFRNLPAGAFLSP